MSDVPTLYFLKELLSNPVWLPNGRQAPWEPVGEDTGVLASNDANILFHLGNLADRHIGGVVKIDEARYIEIKKNVNGSPSPKPLRREAVEGPKAAPANLFPAANPAPVAAPAVVVAAPVEPVVTTPRPVRTGRAKPKPSALP